MLDLARIAHAEEARAAQGLAETADESRPWAGGTMGRGAPGNWSNHAVGVGLAGPVTQDAMLELLDFYHEKAIEPRLELTPFADPTLVDLCARHGFVTRLFENVFFRPLSPSEPVAAPSPAPPGLHTAVIDPADDAAARAFLLAAMSGFYPPGVTPPEDDVRVAMRSVKHPRTLSVAATLDGRIVGGGCMEVAQTPAGPVAALFGLSVLPEHRRKGIQQALIAARLRLAAERGATLATIGSRPGVATERNVRRMGFQLAYTKIAVVRPGPGLSNVAG